MKTTNLALIASLVAAFMATTSSALEPTDLATLGTRPHENANALGVNLRVYRDLAYSTRDDQPNEGAGYVRHGNEYGKHRSGTYFDVYVAKDAFAFEAERAKMPVFLFLHGGSWSQSYDKDVSCHELLRRIAAKGYFVISMNYQLQNDSIEARVMAPRPNATFGDMLADVDTMLAYLKTALPAAGLPTDRIVLGGESAGGHLAMCYAWDQDAPGLSEVKLSHPLRISCVTSVVGPSDLADGEMVAFIFSPAGLLIPPVRGMRMLMGWLTGTDMINMDLSQASVTIRKWAPVTLVKKASCPAILAYGCQDKVPHARSSDSMVPVSNFIGLTNKLAQAGVSYDGKLFTGINHGEVAGNFNNGGSGTWVVDRLAAFKAKHFDEAPDGAAKQEDAK